MLIIQLAINSPIYSLPAKCDGKVITIAAEALFIYVLGTIILLIRYVLRYRKSLALYNILVT